MHGDRREIFHRGNFPRLGTVREVAVRKNNDGNHVFDGDAAGFEGDPEAIAGSGGSEHRNGSFGIAAEESLQQIGLFGFCGKAGGGAAALDVADNQRQFDHDGEAEGFGFQRHAWARCGGDGQSAGIGGANRGSDSRNFVFGLKSGDAEILVHGKLVKNVRSRSDGIGAEEKGKARLLRSGDKSQSQRCVAADIAVDARLQFCGRDFVADLKRFGGFAVTVAGLHGELIGLHELRLVLEFVFEPAERGLHGAVVEPVAHAEGEEILAAVHALGVETQIFQGSARQLGKLDGEQAVTVEGVIFQRVLRDLSFAQIGFLEAIEIDDQNAIGLEVRQVHFQGGGIHGDERIHGIAGGVNVTRREVHLEAADAGQRAGRGANLGGEVGQRGEIVAVEGHGVRELAAGDLHAVAGVTAEADDRLFYGFFLAARDFDECAGHDDSRPRFKIGRKPRGADLRTPLPL